MARDQLKYFRMQHAEVKNKEVSNNHNIMSVLKQYPLHIH